MSDISFTDVKGDYGWLGNMSPHIVKYNDEWYRTAEALFQCMRYEGFPLVQGEIKAAKSPMTAKMAAKKHRALIADKESATDWEAKDLARKLCIVLSVNSVLPVACWAGSVGA